MSLNKTKTKDIFNKVQPHLNNQNYERKELPQIQQETTHIPPTITNESIQSQISSISTDIISTITQTMNDKFSNLITYINEKTNNEKL